MILDIQGQDVNGMIEVEKLGPILKLSKEIEAADKVVKECDTKERMVPLEIMAIQLKFGEEKNWATIKTIWQCWVEQDH